MSFTVWLPEKQGFAHKYSRFDLEDKESTVLVWAEKNKLSGLGSPPSLKLYCKDIGICKWLFLKGCGRVCACGLLATVITVSALRLLELFDSAASQLQKICTVFMKNHKSNLTW